MFRTVILVGVSAAIVLLAGSSAEAQFVRTGRPIQRLDRWLGVGNGPGYHWRNPGPDVSYYNPWSEVNSSLVSGYGIPPYGTPTGYHPRSNYAPRDFTPDWNSNTEFHAPGVPTPAGKKEAGPGSEDGQRVQEKADVPEQGSWYRPELRPDPAGFGHVSLPAYNSASPPVRSTGNRTNSAPLPPLKGN